MTDAGPTFSLHRAMGRRLRVGLWRFAKRDRALRPLLVFSGLGMNLELVAPLADALGDRPVIGFDMPGVGRSPDPWVPYNSATMAMTASVVLDQLEVDRVDVLGISWGGAIAQQFALQHRPRIGSLILASTSAGMAMAPGDVKTIARLADPSEYTLAATMKRNLAMLYNGGGDGVPVSLNAVTPPSPVGWLYQLAAIAGWSSLPALPLLDAPTLIIAGDDDHIVPPLNARILHALIPGSRLKLIEGGGHLVMLSHLDQFAGEIAEFLRAHDHPRRVAAAA